VEAWRPIPLGGNRTLRTVSLRSASEPDGDPVPVVESVKLASSFIRKATNPAGRRVRRDRKLS